MVAVTINKIYCCAVKLKDPIFLWNDFATKAQRQKETQSILRATFCLCALVAKLSLEKECN